MEPDEMEAIEVKPIEHQFEELKRDFQILLENYWYSISARECSISQVEIERGNPGRERRFSKRTGSLGVAFLFYTNSVNNLFHRYSFFSAED